MAIKYGTRICETPGCGVDSWPHSVCYNCDHAARMRKHGIKTEAKAAAPAPASVVKISGSDAVNTWVYVFGPFLGFYKIGVTHNVESRRKGLQTGFPIDVELVCAIKGGTGLERELHSEFEEKRARGEWFSLDSEDLEFLKEMSKNR